MKEKLEELFYEYGAAAIIMLILIALVCYQPYMESKTFNKFKKPGTPEATIIDAMFSELRVEAE